MNEKEQILICIERALNDLKEIDPNLEKMVREEGYLVAGLVGSQSGNRYILIDYTRKVPNTILEYMATTQYLFDRFSHCQEDVCN